MPFTLYLSTTNIVLIILFSALGVLLLGVIGYFAIFAHSRLKKQVRDALRKYEYLHALVFGQDAQFVKRLEMISRINLLYVDIHMRFNKRYKEVKDIDDANMTGAINKMKDLLNDRSYKELKSYLPVVKKKLAEYEEKVNSLNGDLMTVVKPEEECRERSLYLKEKLRAIKQDYYARQSDLSLLVGSFEAVFANIEKEFTKFEGLVESAQYQEAQEMLPKIEAVINQIEKIFQSLPNICVTIQSVIPDKLSSLRNAYDELIRQGYPLSHLITPSDFVSIQNQLDDLTNRIQQFRLADVQNEFDGILARIDDYFEAFEKEKQAKERFEKECGDTYALDNQIEKKYIKLCNGLPNVRKIFLIDSDEQVKIDSIKNQINQVGATKRSLDTLIHSGTRQPYTILVERMEKLHEEVTTTQTAIDDFERYLLSLKTDSEADLAFIKGHYPKLKQAEQTLRLINLDSCDARYLPQIEAQYSLLDETYRLLHRTPIDMGTANKMIAKLSGEGEVLLSSIAYDHQQMVLAESAIRYANRQRMHFGEVNTLLLQSENLYLHGDFKRAYDETLQELRRHHEAS